MPGNKSQPSKAKTTQTAEKASLCLVFGEEDFLVRERASEIFKVWTQPDENGVAPEIEKIEGSVSNVSDAIQALNRVTEALMTFPFFSPLKVIWFQGVNFLGGDGVVGLSAKVNAALKEFSLMLTQQELGSVKLLISAGKTHKGKSFYKNISKVGVVEPMVSWNINDRDWREKATQLARTELNSRGVRLDAAAEAYLIETTGPHPAELVKEIEKLELLQLNPDQEFESGEQESIPFEMAQRMIPMNRNARAFALGDALGSRDLPLILKTLEDEWWSMRQDPKKSVIGLVIGLVSKVRVMLMTKEGVRLGWFDPKMSYPSFQSSFKKIPAGFFPEEKRFNLLANNPYVVYRAMQQAQLYKMTELIEALNLLLECNQALVSSSVDEKRMLRETLSRIAGIQTGP